MARGPKHHMKRLVAPKHWMLSKMAGIWAPRPSSGPHKLRECLPLLLLLRNRLRYAFNRREVISILKRRLLKVDGKIRTDPNFPAGLMDVINIERTKECFRMLYDTKGRFNLHKITPEEAQFKLCRVKRRSVGPRGIPYIGLHDGRVLRFPDPEIRRNDVVKINLKTYQIQGYIKFGPQNICMTTGGRNIGRIGIISKIERNGAKSETVSVRDSRGNTWCTSIKNIFVIGSGEKPDISLPQQRGIRTDPIEDRQHQLSRRKYLSELEVVSA